MDSELVNESPQTCPSTPPPQTGSGNTTEGDEAAKTETKVAIPIPPNPDTKGFGEDSLRLQIAEYLRKHGHDKFHEIFSQAIETTQPSLEDKIIVDEDAMSRIAENIGPYAVQSGLKDLETLVSLETRSWVHPGVCRCYSCEAKKGNEKSIFQWVDSARAYYLSSLEQCLKIAYSRYEKEQEEQSVPSEAANSAGQPSSNGQEARKEPAIATTSVQELVPKIARMADYEDEEGNFLESRLETERPRGLSEKTKKTYAIEVSRPVRRFYTSGKFSFAPVPAGVLKMVINSPQLLSALREVAHYHPPGLLERDQLTIQEPFDFVVQQMARLEEHVANSAENNTLKAHFELLKRFLNEKYGEDLAAEEALRSQKPPRCSFKMLWLLFERGEDVVYRSDKDFRAFVVSETTDPRRQEKKQSKHNGFVIDCWYMDFDGKEFGRVQKSEESSFTIFPFQGSKEITSLPIYPMTYHTDKKGEPTLREHLIERGQKFWKLRSATQKEYKGETLDYGKRYIDSRVMVDYQTYVRLFFDEIMLGQLQIEDEILTSKPIDGCNCFACLQSKEDGAQGRTAVFEKYDHIPVEAESLTEHQLMLLTNRVPGFYLQDRKWVMLNLANVSEYQPAEDDFRQLVLPPGHKEMIEALIKTRKAPGKGEFGMRREAYSADIVKGKGRGLIILLHGAPGVGKTSTAECVAEMTNLPLFPITCGDIGTDATVVEENLKKHFELAQLWNAVLLLDEADVFLQARDINSSSLQRNSLVSVFLRVLEYYEGILFLTTNRVGDFDEAFKSRIHVILYYPRLAEDAVRKIWKNLIENMERVRPGITLSEQAETYILEHKEMRRTKWNGRQIRNAFQTAVALAEYEQNPDGKKPRFIVSRKHFQTVVELSRKFEEYMEKTRGDDALNMEGGHVRAINSDEEENIKERPRKKQGGKKAVRDEDEE